MGKAAKRRRNRRRKHLAGLAKENPARFEMAFEMRIQSWLSEIRGLANQWANGGHERDKRIFEILEEAELILENSEMPKKAIQEILDQICNECATQVARVVDRRLYRLSNVERIDLMGQYCLERKLKNLGSEESQAQ